MARIGQIFKYSAYTGITLFVSTVTAFAASDGTLGTTSTGTSDITIEVPELVMLTGVADLTLNPYAGGDVDLSDDVCVYTNDPDGQYLVTLTGDGGAGSDEFSITDGSAEMVYTAYWNDESGTDVNETEATSGSELGVPQTG